MMLSNYHTHTRFCDGADGVEELILEAIALGCPEIGISGHSFTPFDSGYCMSDEVTEKYKKEVRSLAEKYKDRIKVLLGIELDYYSDTDTRDLDYVIGSVHYVLKNGEYIPVDLSREVQLEAVNKHYGGDFYAFAEDYYRLVGELYEKTGCNVIGHFDLISKFNGEGSVFDKNNERYVSAARNALRRLKKTPAVFEINTGAMSRGYRLTAYPDPIFLDEMTEGGRPLLISSDAHKKEHLLFGIEKEKEKLDFLGSPYIVKFSEYL